MFQTLVVEVGEKVEIFQGDDRIPELFLGNEELLPGTEARKPLLGGRVRA